MITTPTVDRLLALRLRAMADATAPNSRTRR